MNANQSHIDADGPGLRRVSPVRVAAWSAGALLLIAPLIAMQFTDEVVWDAFDFLVFGALLLGVLLPFDLVARSSSGTAFRAAAGTALLGAFLLVWLNLAVGMIGSEDNPANLMYALVIAIGLTGSFIARFRPTGMARAMIATALALVAVALVAVIAGLGQPYSGPLEVLLLNGFFVALFAGSAFLFRMAARRQS
jgi:hypothetical protein